MFYFLVYASYIRMTVHITREDNGCRVKSRWIGGLHYNSYAWNVMRRGSDATGH